MCLSDVSGMHRAGVHTNCNTFKDSNWIQQCFSSETEAALWRVLPLIEDLQTLWEKKCDGAAGFKRFLVYKDAIQNGLDKLRKYYNKFDEKPAYILTLSKLSLLFLLYYLIITDYTNSLPSLLQA
jgi:hypothetical protein